MAERQSVAHRTQAIHPLVCGGAGGLLGGIVMAAAAMVLFPVMGLGSAFRPLILIGALFDQNWGQRGFALVPFLFGTALHVAMSVALGVLFAWLVNYSRGRMVVVSGFVFGLVVWLINHLGILWIVNPAAAGGIPLWLFAVVHVLYGLTLGGFVAWTRKSPVARPAAQTAKALTRPAAPVAPRSASPAPTVPQGRAA